MNQLYVTFDGPRISEEGVPVASLIAALGGVQDAMRMMVGHLGGRQPGPGQPPKWVREQSTLRLAATRPGSVAAELTLESPANGRPRLDDYGPQAFDAFLNWDGSEDSILPKAVTDKLFKIPSKLPDGTRLWIGNADDPRKIEVKRRYRSPALKSKPEEALLQGWLKAVNWDKRTAQLHRRHVPYVRLRFYPQLDDDMLRLATQYVGIRGFGSFDENDNWATVQVEQITEVEARGEPFDIEAFLNGPEKKVFEPEKIVTASEPFDADEFISTIREGRDVGRKELSDW